MLAFWKLNYLHSAHRNQNDTCWQDGPKIKSSCCTDSCERFRWTNFFFSFFTFFFFPQSNYRYVLWPALIFLWLVCVLQGLSQAAWVSLAVHAQAAGGNASSGSYLVAREQWWRNAWAKLEFWVFAMSCSCDLGQAVCVGWDSSLPVSGSL